MNIDLSTHYLGMKLKNPLGAAACGPLTGNVDTLRRLEEAGAAIVVLPSMFEEQIEHEEEEIVRLYESHTESFAESLSLFPEMSEYRTGPSEYLKHVAAAKQALSIPVVASLNGASSGGWVEYAKAIEAAGADALELNIYFVPTSAQMTAHDVEQRYVDLVEHVCSTVSLPVAVKIGQNFTSLPNFAHRLVEAGAQGLVLFNRYLEADIDLDALCYRPDLVLSTRHEARVPIRWIAILRDQIQASLGATSGVHRVQGVVKLLMAGADATFMASVLLAKGPEFIAILLDDLRQWLVDNEYETVEQLIGCMSRGRCPDPGVLERANYMKALIKYTSEYGTVPQSPPLH